MQYELTTGWQGASKKVIMNYLFGKYAKNLFVEISEEEFNRTGEL